jgi:hypothetical protein
MDGRRAFTTFFGHIGGAFLSAWLFMLLLGGIHSHVEFIPAIGYWASFLVVLAIRVITPTNPVYWFFEDWKDA